MLKTQAHENIAFGPPKHPLILKHFPAGRQEGIAGSRVRSCSPSPWLRLFYTDNSSCPPREDVPPLPTCSSCTSLSHFSSHDSVLSSLPCSCLVQTSWHCGDIGGKTRGVAGLELPRAVPCACPAWSPEGPCCGGRGQSGPCGHWEGVARPQGLWGWGQPGLG